MKDKRGLEMAINTIVRLVLALILLGALVLFLTGNFTNFFGKIGGYSSKSNVDPVVDNCNILADTAAQYSYCCEEKTVKYLVEGELEEGDFNCLEVNDRFGGVKGMSCAEVSC